jgi:hypothetical protein
MVPTDSTQWLLEVDKRDIAYDAEQSIIELIISPDYLEDTDQLVHALSKEVYIKKIKTHPKTLN